MANGMDKEKLRREIAQLIQSMEAALERLGNALAHRPVWAVLEPHPAGGDFIRRASEAYSAINYGMTDAIGESPVCLGVIGATAEVVKCAQAVNLSKAALKAACVPLQAMRSRIPVKGEEGPIKAVPLLRVILRNIQRSDLNLLAAYRKIPILGAPPLSVTYTHANTRAVYRKSVEDIDTLLSNLQHPAAATDRERLRALPRQETHLALTKARYLNTRANVVYARLDSRGRGRVQITAELPLIYAAGRSLVAPTVTFPPTLDTCSLQPSRQRQAHLRPQRFLDSIPVYRYAS
jgi:hypothetical protein